MAEAGGEVDPHLPKGVSVIRTVSRITVLAFSCLVLVLAASESRADHANIPVARLQVYHKLDPGSITVSGISSGAFFAHQFHVAYSSLVKGAGLVAGGLYRCADQVEQVSPPFGNPLFLFGVSRNVVAALAVCPIWDATTLSNSGGSFPTSLTLETLRNWPSRPTGMV